MRVFIFEHICGGGLARVDLRQTLARKGGAMLSALVDDFVHAGVEVVTSLDRRVDLALPGAHVEAVDPSADFPVSFDRLAQSVDAALIVAPEFDRLLESWARRLERLGVRSLGCSPDAIALCGDKMELAQHLLRAGVATPVTTLGIPAAPSGAMPHGDPCPLVAKPRFGAGCEDTFICRSASDLAALPHREDWITQPLVPGRAASCAFIVHGSQVRPLRAGEQFVEGRGRLAYRGGRLPLPPQAECRAIELGRRAVAAVPGLRGYVGVDLVLADPGATGGLPGATGSLPASAGDARGDEDALKAGGPKHWLASCQWHPDVPGGDQVIEINPRPTVAFTGLRRLCRTSLAAAILDPAAPLAWEPRCLRYDAAGQMTWEEAEL